MRIEFVRQENAEEAQSAPALRRRGGKRAGRAPALATVEEEEQEEPPPEEPPRKRGNSAKKALVTVEEEVPDIADDTAPNKTFAEAAVEEAEAEQKGRKTRAKRGVLHQICNLIVACCFVLRYLLNPSHSTCCVFSPGLPDLIDCLLALWGFFTPGWHFSFDNSTGFL